MSNSQLKQLIADCNNCIMKGLYSGDDMLMAATLMCKLTDIFDSLPEDEEEPTHE